MKEITARQRMALKFIDGEITKNGRAPSLVELGKHMGITTKCAHEYVTALHKKAFIHSERGVARGITILKRD
jgi:SOS-response transcriptional repressor LexA